MGIGAGFIALIAFRRDLHTVSMTHAYWNVTGSPDRSYFLTDNILLRITAERVHK